MKKRLITGILLATMLSPSVRALNLTGEISLKTPGRTAVDYPLKDMSLSTVSSLPIAISSKTSPQNNGTKRLDVTLKANETVYFNLSISCFDEHIKHEGCQFYLPGFWYHKNLRSPDNAPSFRISDSWQVREDRLSVPLTGIYQESDGHYITVLRLNDKNHDCDAVVQNYSGDVILSGNTSIGFTGFTNKSGIASLSFGYPYREAPKRYIRKLTLIPPVRTYKKLEKGESISLSWLIYEGKAKDYSEFISNVWNYSYDVMQPVPVDGTMSADEAKSYLANYFEESYVDKYDLKYFSGQGLLTENCNNTGDYQVGFIGRVLLNAFNAIEYGESTQNKSLIKKGESVLSSVLKHGFTPEGYFIEAANLERGTHDPFLSIRRQSEGVYAILLYLDYERSKGRYHVEWERRAKKLLDKMLTLQNTDGSFPRKFDESHNHIDGTGGSTPSATLPLVMAYKYFKDKRYLNAAKSTGSYLEKEIIDKSDYFSSTLDADCEDKEAALYASTAMYYLSLVTKGKEKSHYLNLCRKSAYFCLSWYYLWDVPFAQGQMLGDVGFLSRGWGNVSVENNHIDVFIFEFATILDKLGQHFGDNRFGNFAQVIRTSMLQLMPRENNMYDIAKTGFYPEVVQHTTWDYGKNGKGFYNDLFAPGWTVASLWQMLSPNRVDNFFSRK